MNDHCSNFLLFGGRGERRGVCFIPGVFSAINSYKLLCTPCLPVLVKHTLRGFCFLFQIFPVPKIKAWLGLHSNWTNLVTCSRLSQSLWDYAWTTYPNLRARDGAGFSGTWGALNKSKGVATNSQQQSLPQGPGARLVSRPRFPCIMRRLFQKRSLPTHFLPSAQPHRQAPKPQRR